MNVIHGLISFGLVALGIHSYGKDIATSLEPAHAQRELWRFRHVWRELRTPGGAASQDLLISILSWGGEKGCAQEKIRAEEGKRAI